jgi:hypothetical protein
MLVPYTTAVMSVLCYWQPQTVLTVSLLNTNFARECICQTLSVH